MGPYPNYERYIQHHLFIYIQFFLQQSSMSNLFKNEMIQPTFWFQTQKNTGYDIYVWRPICNIGFTFKLLMIILYTFAPEVPKTSISKSKRWRSPSLFSWSMTLLLGVSQQTSFLTVQYWMLKKESRDLSHLFLTYIQYINTLPLLSSSLARTINSSFFGYNLYLSHYK